MVGNAIKLISIKVNTNSVSSFTIDNDKVLWNNWTDTLLMTMLVCLLYKVVMKTIMSLPKLMTVYDSMLNDEDVHDSKYLQEEEEEELSKDLSSIEI